MPIRVSKPVVYSMFSVLILAFVITVVASEPVLLYYEYKIHNYFNGWEDNPYIVHKHDCSDMSPEVEQYVETVLGLPCFFVYGSKYDNGTISSGHMWTMIQIDNCFYEFESTSLCFKTVSRDYRVWDVQQGFYIDGIRQDKSQDYKDWKEDFKEFIR